MRIICLVGWIGFAILSFLQTSKSLNFDFFDEPKLTLALSFSNSADACLLDVRDKNVNFINSKNCGALGAMSLAYGSALGGKINERAYSHTLYVEGLQTAWSAAALSNAQYGTKVISLW